METKARFVFGDARVWRYMVASIEKILDEGVFVVSQEGVSLRAMDLSKIVMVDLFYPESSFREFEPGEGETEFGVSFNVFSKVLRRARKNDELEIRVGESSIEVVFRGRGRRLFRIPQIMLTYQKLPEPKIPITVTATMTSTVFRESIRTIEPIADAVMFEADEDGEKLYIRGEGDIERAELVLSLERGSLIDLTVESPDSALYTLEYFSQMMQAAQAANTVVVKYSQDAPVRVDMQYPPEGRLTFYVSPRIE